MTVNTDGTFTYTASRQTTSVFVASDSFTVLANDGLANSAAQTINVTLTAAPSINLDVNPIHHDEFFVVNTAPLVRIETPLFVAETDLRPRHEISRQPPPIILAHDILFSAQRELTSTDSLFTKARSARLFESENIVLSGGRLVTRGHLLVWLADVDCPL